MFTRNLGILLMVMTLLAVPQMVSNYMGGGLKSVGAASSKIYFMQFSVANQPLTATNDYFQLHNYLTIIPDAVYSLVFFLFLLHWERRSQQIVEEMKKENQLPSYFTIEIGNNKIFSDELRFALKEFGEIQEIA
ncbi:MAG: hypothetical protein JST59_01925 [Actinobacteria bacterium]|nr:hypothetical protein [Actinomycetota bacterium]